MLNTANRSGGDEDCEVNLSLGSWRSLVAWMRAVSGEWENKKRTNEEGGN